MLGWGIFAHKLPSSMFFFNALIFVYLPSPSRLQFGGNSSDRFGVTSHSQGDGFIPFAV